MKCLGGKELKDPLDIKILTAILGVVRVKDEFGGFVIVRLAEESLLKTFVPSGRVNGVAPAVIWLKIFCVSNMKKIVVCLCICVSGKHMQRFMSLGTSPRFLCVTL